MEFLIRLDEALSQERDPKDQQIIDIIHRRILRGKGMVKKALKRGYFSMDQIINAIRHKRCLALPNRDVGFTHLSNAIGSAITDTMSGQDINYARSIFSLKPIDIKKEKAKRAQRQRVGSR